MMSDINREYEMTTPILVRTTVYIRVLNTFFKEKKNTKGQSLRGWRSEGVGIGHASWSLLT